MLRDLVDIGPGIARLRFGDAVEEIGELASAEFCDLVCVVWFQADRGVPDALCVCA
jgi:hypothetical protein